MSRASLVWSLTVVLLWALSAPPLAEPAPCTCPDMLDMASRSLQAKTAIRTYQEQLATWAAAGGAPDGGEAERALFQRETVEPPMTEVKDRRANTASANTGTDCRTTVDAPTACFRELMEQHEHEHRSACLDHAAANPPGTRPDMETPRWGTLADYAREEIEAYKTELIYIEAVLSNLERDCRYTLEFESTIYGAMETTRSEAKTRVDLAVHFPRGYTSSGLTGARPLNYNTRDIGPPKAIGDPMLMKLAPICYAASDGAGEVSFEVRDAWLMRERTPPYGPLLELPIYVGDTQETRRLKGQRGCPRSAEPRSFWTEQFKLGKRIEPAQPLEARPGAPSVSGLAVFIESWTFSASEDDAEKTIETACAGFGGVEGLGGFAGLPLMGNVMCEKTVLRLKRKR